MRLGQMARKLGISQAEIIRYLSGQNIEIEGGSNLKLEDHHIHKLYAHFAPTTNIETKSSADELTQGPSDSVEDPAIVGDEGPAPVSEPPSASTPDQVVLVEENPDSDAAGEGPADLAPTALLNAESPDTIRASKIELAGLKVLGRIDLPGPKKKEVTPVDESATTAEVPSDAPEQRDAASTDIKLYPERQNESIAGGDDGRKERIRRDEGRNQEEGKRSRNIKPREQRPRKNPIAAQRERELEAERERQKEKAAQEKERRTQNYHKRVKHSPPTKAVRLFEEPVEQLNASSLKAEPTTWFGKFVKWLRE